MDWAARGRGAAQPTPNPTKAEEPQKGASYAKERHRVTWQHCLQLFEPSAPFRGQKFLGATQDFDGLRCEEETVFSAFIAVEYVRILASREGFFENAGARPSWPQQPRTLALLRSNLTRSQDRTRRGQDGRAPMRVQLHRAVFFCGFLICSPGDGPKCNPCPARVGGWRV